MSDGILNINNLRISISTDKGRIYPVDDISLRVNAGEIIGLVGESGCGKSVTAMSIMKLLEQEFKVESGEILFCGKDVYKMSKKDFCNIRGNDISLIFQEPATCLNPVKKIGVQLTEALRVHNKISVSDARVKCMDMLRRVGISDVERRFNSYPHQLSGGIIQRIMIAMAMICKPKLLIADEPTTALDVTMEMQILDLMKELADESGTAIILITHNMGAVAQICDYVYVMYAGRIMEEAKTADIFLSTSHPYTKGLLASIPDIDNKVERLNTIEGVVPPLSELGCGCGFYERCGRSVDRCLSERPDKINLGDDHSIYCFNAIDN